MPLTIIEELIFGSGAWIGFLFITIACFVAITLYRGLGVLTFVINILLSLKYLELYSAGNSNFTWFFILALISAVMQILYMLKRKD